MHIFLMFAIETKAPAQAKDTVVEKSEAMKDTTIEKGTQAKDTSKGNYCKHN